MPQAHTCGVGTAADRRAIPRAPEAKDTTLVTMSDPATLATPNTERVVALVRRWLAESAEHPAEVSAERLAGVLKDPNGLAFTVGFVDGVMRPEDLGVAGRNLEQVAKLTPKFLPWYLRAAIRVGGVVAPVLPWAVIPIARRVLRQMV